MTLTDELAQALRGLAEKNDKFDITYDCGHDMDWMFVGDAEFPLERLYDSEHFTLDHMDAIASAIGMEFEVMRIEAKFWGFAAYEGEAFEQCLYYPQLYPTKRTASMSALLACINYRMGLESAPSPKGPTP